MGGLAVHRKSKEGIAFGGGASYWDKATGEQLQIMIHIGEDPASEDYSIPEPFDVYLLKGVLYGTEPHNGIWDDRTIGLKPAAKYPNGNGSVLPVLPASFALFKL